jgi:hypothetical protein
VSNAEGKEEEEEQQQQQQQQQKIFFTTTNCASPSGAWLLRGLTSQLPAQHARQESSNCVSKVCVLQPRRPDRTGTAQGDRKKSWSKKRTSFSKCRPRRGGPRATLESYCRTVACACNANCQPNTKASNPSPAQKDRKTERQRDIET